MMNRFHSRWLKRRSQSNHHFSLSAEEVRLGFESLEDRRMLAVVFDRPTTYPGATSFYSSQNAGGSGFVTYDKFTPSATGSVNQVEWVGSYINESNPEVNPVSGYNTLNWNFDFYNSAGGKLGSQLASRTVSMSQVTVVSLGQQTSTIGGGTVVTHPVYRFTATLPSAVTLNSGTEYWFSVVSLAGIYDPHFSWASGSGSGGNNQSEQENLSNPGAYALVTGDRAFKLSSNTPPTTTGIANVFTTEDGPPASILMDSIFHDAETAQSSLNVTVVGNTNPGLFNAGFIYAGNGSIYPNNFALQPNPNAFGSTTFTFRATDQGGLSVDTSFTATVTPMADTPSVTDAMTQQDTQSTSGLVIARNPVDGAEVTHYRISNITGGTLYQNNGTTPIAPGTFITAAQGGAGLKFTPTPGSIQNGSFRVQAATGPNVGQLGGDLVTATIHVEPAGPPTLQFDAPSYRISEDAVAIGAAVTILRSGVLGDPLTATISLGGGTATPGADYAIAPLNISFGPNDTVQHIVIPIQQDTFVEPDETVNLTLNANGGVMIGSQATAVVTIDDDDDGIAALSVSSVSQLEGDSGTSVMTFNVMLNVDVATPFSVDYSTASDSAIAGIDFFGKNGALNFAGTAGETKSVSVTIIGDTTIEPTEQFFLQLSNPQAGGASISLGSGIGTILTDDATPGVITWIAPGDGDWNSPANWQDNLGANRVPTPVDTILINNAATPQTITIHSTDFVAISSGLLTLGGGNTLVNEGQFLLSGTGNMQTRQGSIIENRTGSLLDFVGDADLDFVSGSIFPLIVNEGTIRKSGGTGTSFIEAQFSNRPGGVIDVQTGTLQLSNNGVSEGGTFVVAAGAVLDLTATQTAVYQGSYVGTGAGTVLLDSGTFSPGTGVTLDFAPGLLHFEAGTIGTGTLTNIGFIQATGIGSLLGPITGAVLDNYGTLTIVGALRNAQNSQLINHASGVIDFAGDGDIDLVSGTNFPVIVNEGTIRKTAGSGTSFLEAQFSNRPGGVIEVQSGVLQLNNNGTSEGGQFIVAAGAVLDLTANLTAVYQGSYVGAGGGTVLLDSGGFNAGTGATLDFAPGMFQLSGGSFGPGTITNNGSLQAVGTGTLLTNGATLENNGTLTLIGTLRTQQNSQINNRTNGVIDFAGDGALDFVSGAVRPTILNEGRILKSAGSMTSLLEGALMNFGSLDVQTGTLQMLGSLDNNGIVHVAASSVLQLTSTVLTNLGTLSFDIAGTPGSGQFGKSTTTNVLPNLGGTLVANGTGGYTPQIGDSYTLLTYPAKNGGFASTSSSTMSFSTAENSTNVTITVVETYDADFDGDGDVDGRDFLAWQRGRGKPNATLPDGDADGDHDVDAVDLSTWRYQYGFSVTQLQSLSASEEVSGSAALLDNSHNLQVARLSAGLVDAALALIWLEAPHEVESLAVVENSLPTVSVARGSNQPLGGSDSASFGRKSRPFQHVEKRNALYKTEDFPDELMASAIGELFSE